MCYRSNAKSTLNHLNRAVERAKSDSKRALYSKTVSEYDDAVASLVQLAEALSRILNKKVTVTVDDVPADQQLAFHIPTVYQQVKSAEDVQELKKQVKKLSKKVNKNSEDVRQLARIVEKQSEESAKNVIALSECVASVASAVKSLSGSTPSGAQQPINKVNADEPGALCYKPSELSKGNGQTAQDANKESEHRSSASNSDRVRSAASGDVFKGTAVVKAFGKYGDEDVHRKSFAQSLAYVADGRSRIAVTGRVRQICKSVEQWCDVRLRKDIPVKNGRKCYHLYQFPRVLAYYVGYCAKVWRENPGTSLTDLDPLSEFVELVESKPDLPYIAPSFLCAGSKHREELSVEDVAEGYAYWLQLVRAFNDVQDRYGLGQSLDNQFYPSKMYALGFVNEKQAVYMQNRSYETFSALGMQREFCGTR